uniref:Uncharacterized protein n=1 Tax=Fagus sylvatica TaxID=28930 RepID=A0A2N9G8T3_FAGSY
MIDLKDDLKTDTAVIRYVQVGSEFCPIRVGSGLADLACRTCARRVPGARWCVLGMRWHALGTCWHVGRVQRVGGTTGAWQHVGPPMEVIPPWLARLGEQEPDSDVHFSIRCLEEWVLRPAGTTARDGMWSFLAGALTSAWWHVQAPIVIILLGFCRSGNQLSIGSPHSCQNSQYRFPQTAPIVQG